MKENYVVTHEKHLDHMVRVVPMIFTFYVIQCFVMLKISPTDFTQNSLLFLGVFLAVLISSLLFYDLKHKAEISSAHFIVSFMFQHHMIEISDIQSVDVSNPGQSFSTVTLKTSKKKYRIFFVDDAVEVKDFIEDLKRSSQIAA